MGYKQGSLNVLKGQIKNKAAGLVHGDSMAMQVDPKDGAGAKGKDKSKKAERPKQMGFWVGSGLVKNEGDRKKEFREAFKEARKVMGSGGTFSFQIGKEKPKTYTTKYKEEVSSPFKLDQDPEKGVTVTGDASKIGGVTSTAKERRQEKLARKKEALRIKTANKRMEAELARETKKAEAGKRRIQAQQKLRKKQGKDYMTSEGTVIRRR